MTVPQGDWNGPYYPNDPKGPPVWMIPVVLIVFIVFGNIINALTH
jgi:hypothetical protein